MQLLSLDIDGPIKKQCKIKQYQKFVFQILNLTYSHFWNIPQLFDSLLIVGNNLLMKTNIFYALLSQNVALLFLAKDDKMFKVISIYGFVIFILSD